MFECRAKRSEARRARRPPLTPTEARDNPGYDATGDAATGDQQYHIKPPGEAAVVTGSEEEQETCFTQVPTFAEEKLHAGNKGKFPQWPIRVTMSNMTFKEVLICQTS